MKIERIDIIGQNGNTAEHYSEIEAKAAAFDAYIEAAGNSFDFGMKGCAVVLNAILDAEILKRKQKPAEYTDNTNYFGEDVR